MTLALDDITVLDFGRYIAAPYCAALLGDLGADVIRIEPIGGSEDRYIIPIAPTGEGAMHLQVNRNKRSLSLDMTQPEAKAVVRRLIEKADVIVVNLPPKALAKIGLDYETVSALNPKIILTTVTAYGTESEFANEGGFDGIGQALSGGVHLTGTGAQPYRSAVSYIDYSTGLSAVYGTLGALLARAKDGRGRHVEVSLLNTALSMTNSMLIDEASGARKRLPIGNRSAVAGPSDIYATKDGWILLQVVGDKMFARWAKLVGAPTLTEDPRFISDMGRGENGAALSEICSAWCAGLTNSECIALLRKAGVPACAIVSPAEALQTKEVAEGGYFAMHPVPGTATTVPIVKTAADLSSGAVDEPTPAPRLGEHTREILSAIGFDDELIDDFQRRSIVGARTADTLGDAKTANQSADH